MVLGPPPPVPSLALWPRGCGCGCDGGGHGGHGGSGGCGGSGSGGSGGPGGCDGSGCPFPTPSPWEVIPAGPRAQPAAELPLCHLVLVQQSAVNNHLNALVSVTALSL